MIIGFAKCFLIATCTRKSVFQVETRNSYVHFAIRWWCVCYGLLLESLQTVFPLNRRQESICNSITNPLADPECSLWILNNKGFVLGRYKTVNILIKANCWG